MPTRLEGVQIPVELDTSKAQRQLDDLERDLDKQERTGKRLQDTIGRGPGSKPSPSGRMTGSSNPDIAQELYNDLLKQIKVDRMRTSSQVRLEQARQANTVSGKLNTAIEGAVGDGLGAGLKFAGSLYAAISATSKAAPIVLEAGRALAGLSPNDPNFKAVAQQLENLRNSVTYLESYVKSAVTGIGKTYDMATAISRVHGKVPNLSVGYGIYKEADMQEDMLNKKFSEFKAKEVANAVGVSISEMFEGGLNR
jgi:hypothetical protein